MGCSWATTPSGTASARPQSPSTRQIPRLFTSRKRLVFTKRRTRERHGNRFLRRGSARWPWIPRTLRLFIAVAIQTSFRICPASQRVTTQARVGNRLVSRIKLFALWLSIPLFLLFFTPGLNRDRFIAAIPAVL